MLLVQDISLGWGKEERGAECARARARFPMEYPVVYPAGQKPFLGEAAVQNLRFWQKGTKFRDCMQKDHTQWIWDSYAHLKEMNLTDLTITAREEEKPLIKEISRKAVLLEVVFFYDEHRSGKPFRRGHNRDYHNSQSPFYRKDCLNETAFVLKEGQYGRVVWNERKTDYDTGEWYYQLHVINLYYSQDKAIDSNIFTAHSPDVVYTQTAEVTYSHH